jgi:hypothetical protein
MGTTEKPSANVVPQLEISVRIKKTGGIAGGFSFSVDADGGGATIKIDIGNNQF